jgi:hypothetical protein
MAGRPQRRARGGPQAPDGAAKPARGYYGRPPFAPGNDLAATHGAYSERKVSPLAAEVEAALPGIAPWATAPTFEGAVHSYCWVEAQLALVRQYVDEQGLLDDDGNPRPVLTLLDRLEGRAASLRSELGLTPLALAKLLGSLATTAAVSGDDDALETLKAEGARILAARALGDGSGES